jgi:hypothetical protein
MSVKIIKQFNMLTGRTAKKIRKELAKTVKDALPKAVISEIKRGKSPKANGRWDKPYSKSYRSSIAGVMAFRKIGGKIIPIRIDDKGKNKSGSLSSYAKKVKKEEKSRLSRKRLAPVNLKLSGELLKSIKSVLKSNGKIEISFNKKTPEGDDLANIHTNRGIPRSDKDNAIREMLPSKGEAFNNTITDNLARLLKRTLKILIRKENSR